MSRILTCTWAPTAIAGPKLTRGDVRESALATATGPDLVSRLATPVERAESLGIDHLLVAQRWWGTGEEIEASSFDCLAMTAYYAAVTSSIRLVTAIHPGFFLPAAIAKWGATLDRVTGGRWAINITSGWHEQEFGMFGAELVPHDERYARSREFIEVLRAAWTGDEVDYRGQFYRVDGLRLEPHPSGPLTVFQGGQSDAAQDLAAGHSDWMFLNGGPPDKVRSIIERVRDKAASRGRTVRFALYAIPLCRGTDREAEDTVASMVANIDPDRVVRRRERVSGATGMWQESADPLTTLDSNEGFASRLIGSPATIERRMLEFHDLGVDMFHLALNDERFVAEVLPRIQAHR